jgi:hypothetical protein
VVSTCRHVASVCPAPCPGDGGAPRWPAAQTVGTRIQNIEGRVAVRRMPLRLRSARQTPRAARDTAAGALPKTPCGSEHDCYNPCAAGDETVPLLRVERERVVPSPRDSHDPLGENRIIPVRTSVAASAVMPARSSLASTAVRRCGCLEVEKRGRRRSRIRATRCSRQWVTARSPRSAWDAGMVWWMCQEYVGPDTAGVGVTVVNLLGAFSQSWSGHPNGRSPA